MWVVMKVSELIDEFVPCKICGNNDVENFYFYVSVDKGSQPYVKCCECEEEYYSTSASKILARESKKARTESRIIFKERMGIDLRDQKPVHPLVKLLARI